MNIKVEKHSDICDELNQIYERKNHDYGDSFHKSWIEEGMAMPRIRLGDKFLPFQDPDPKRQFTRRRRSTSQRRVDQRHAA